jgi:hypothetical protein
MVPQLATLVAALCLGAAILLAFWQLRVAVTTFAPTVAFAESFSLQLSGPFVLLALGVIALHRIRSVDSLAAFCITGILATIIFAVGGLFVFATGYNFSKYNPVPVPRALSIASFAISIVTLALTAVAIRARNAVTTRLTMGWSGP